MANTFSQVYLHIIFAAKCHEDYLNPMVLPRIHQYIGGVIKKFGHIPIVVGGVQDHVHILISYNLNQSVPELVKNIKLSTSKFIKTNNLSHFVFKWQRGYACFSHSHSQVNKVVNYIRNQWNHHKSQSLREELESELNKRGIVYESQYLFDE